MDTNKKLSLIVINTCIIFTSVLVKMTLHGHFAESPAVMTSKRLMNAIDTTKKAIIAMVVTQQTCD